MENTIRQLRFFGTVTAGATHDINNVLSVIKENIGLMEDLFMMAEKQGIKIPYDEKITKSLSSVKEAVKKGAQVTADLNTFAHLPDYDKRPVRVSDSLGMIVRLNGRKASRLGVRLVLPESAEIPDYVVQPVMLSRVINMAMSAALESVGQGSDLKAYIKADESQTSFQLLFSLESASEGLKGKILSNPSYEDLKEAAEALSAEVYADDSGITLKFRK